MKKLILFCILSSLSFIANAQYTIMGYYPNPASQDYVVVYNYYTCNGQFVVSHCRTNAIRGDIYSNTTYLDIETCTLKKRILDDSD